MIKSLTAYRDSAGTLYTSLDEVQTAERRAMYADVLKAGTAANPQLARLDVDLVVDLCMALGKTIGSIANDRLAPQGGAELKVVVHHDGGVLGAASSLPTAAHAAILAAARGESRIAHVSREAILAETLRREGKEPRDIHAELKARRAEKLTPEAPAKKPEPIPDLVSTKTPPFGIPANPTPGAVDPAVSRAEGMEPRERLLTAHHPEFSAPYGGSTDPVPTASYNTDGKVWPKHPLDSFEDTLVAEIMSDDSEAALRQAAGVSSRGN